MIGTDFFMWVAMSIFWYIINFFGTKLIILIQPDIWYQLLIDCFLLLYNSRIALNNKNATKFLQLARGALRDKPDKLYTFIYILVTMR